MNIIIICYLIIAAFLAGEHYADKVKVEKPGSRDWREEILVMFIGGLLWIIWVLVLLVVRVRDYIALDLDVESYWRLITRKKLTQRQIKIVEQLVIDGTLKKNKTILDRHKLFVAKLLLKYNRP